jgi:hypothetical protein
LFKIFLPPVLCLPSSRFPTTLLSYAFSRPFLSYISGPF